MLVFVCLLSFLAVSKTFPTDDGLVETSRGKISGFESSSRDGRPFWAWMGIPYAKPPVGKLRLAAPEPSEGWEGILKAADPPPPCMQPYDIRQMPKTSEDCLYLNVYRPKIDRKPLPVLVYVHGGNFIMGYSGSIDHAEFIMDEDVVLVTVTYRLAALGFMSMNHTAFPGNYGLKDQALALRWVKDNVGSFGGNPDSITVFGESAGGACSHLLLMSPLTRDTVSRSVSISGVANKVWSLKQPDQVVSDNRLLAEGLGCNQSDPSEVLECLRGIDASRFSEYFLNKKDLSNPIVPVIEPEGPGAFAPTALTKAEVTKPMIVSFSAGEYLLMKVGGQLMGLGLAKMAADVDGFLTTYSSYIVGTDDERTPVLLENVKAAYFGSNDTNQVTQAILTMFQDMTFVYPAMSVAESNKGPVWVYHMEYRGEYTLFDVLYKQNSTVPCHADEVLLLFNYRKYYPRASQRLPRKKDIRKSKELIKYIVNFAYHDNPTPDDASGLPTWKPFGGNEILRFKTGQSVMADSNFVEEQKKIRKFWSGIFGDEPSK